MLDQNKGFTLVELMVVVAIIGILVAIAVPIFGEVTDSAERSAAEGNLRTIDGAIMMYRADKGNYPVSGDEGDKEKLNVDNDDWENSIAGYIEEFEPAGEEDYALYHTGDSVKGALKGDVGGACFDEGNWQWLPIEDWDTDNCDENGG